MAENRLRERRLALGLALREVARRVAIAPSYLTDLELGRRQPSRAVAGRLCSVLGEGAITLPPTQRG